MPIPAEKAIQMVRTAHSQAAQLDIAVTAVVVDESGRIVALARMDKARPITVDMALNKAYTAASFELPTSSVAEQAKRAWFRSLMIHSKGRIMPVGGGFPIIDPVGEIAVIGAIGVAGGRNAEQDTLCCRVGRPHSPGRS